MALERRDRVIEVLSGLAEGLDVAGRSVEEKCRMIISRTNQVLNHLCEMSVVFAYDNSSLTINMRVYVHRTWVQYLQRRMISRKQHYLSSATGRTDSARTVVGAVIKRPYHPLRDRFW
jgi:hypothetical protein